MNGLPLRNITCIKKNCMTEATACLADAVCVQNFQCAGSCGDNSTCTFMCSESYKSKAQDNLMYCMFEEHQCLTLPPPSPIDNATCRSPKEAVVAGVDKVLMEGDWYVTHGFNPDYDCFACQILSFDF
jgi:hypothetical protein